MPPAHDRALRRAVAGLAQLHADDIAAVLGALGVKERKAVEALLREHATQFEMPSAAPLDDRLTYDISKFSPWLVERLEGVGESRHAIATQTRESLRELAARTYPLVLATGKVGKRAGIVARAASLFSRGEP